MIIKFDELKNGRKKSVKFSPSDKNNSDCILHCPLKKYREIKHERYDMLENTSNKYYTIILVCILLKSFLKIFFREIKKCFVIYFEAIHT